LIAQPTSHPRLLRSTRDDGADETSDVDHGALAAAGTPSTHEPAAIEAKHAPRRLHAHFFWVFFLLGGFSFVRNVNPDLIFHFLFEKNKKNKKI
jgi:hypothetical protein